MLGLQRHFHLILRQLNHKLSIHFILFLYVIVKIFLSSFNFGISSCVVINLIDIVKMINAFFIKAFKYMHYLLNIYIAKILKSIITYWLE